MSRIIGIDPGLSAIGYGIIEVKGNSFTHVHHGTIKTRSTEPIGKRLQIIYTEILRIIKETLPDEASVESIFFAKNMKSAIPVAHARGAILLALAQADVPIFEYTPLEVKQAVVGKGRADKGQVQVMMKMLLHLNTLPSPDHAADALAIAFCHSSYSLINTYMDKISK